MFRATIQAGQSALRASALINGGGAVATLAFIGNLARNRHPIPKGLAAALTLFCTGVLANAVAAGATYVSQYLYERDSEGMGDRFRKLAIVLVVGSYVTFTIAVAVAYAAFVAGPRPV